MTDSQLNALKADFLEWTGGFEPETVQDIDTYITASMPFDLPEDDARDALRNWMEQTASCEVRRDVDKQ